MLHFLVGALLALPTVSAAESSPAVAQILKVLADSDKPAAACIEPYHSCFDARPCCNPDVNFCIQHQCQPAPNLDTQRPDTGK
jgi:hypothetical protein